MNETENNHGKLKKDPSDLAQSRTASAIQRQAQMDKVRAEVRANLIQNRQQRQELSKKRAQTQGSWEIFRDHVQARLKEIRNEGRKARQAHKNQKAAAAAAGGAPNRGTSSPNT